MRRRGLLAAAVFGTAIAAGVWLTSAPDEPGAPAAPRATATTTPSLAAALPPPPTPAPPATVPAAAPPPAPTEAAAASPPVEVAIVDAVDGAPLPDARVAASTSAVEVEARGEGRFRVHGTPPSIGLSLRASAPGHLPTDTAAVRGVEELPARIALARAGRLTGRVVAPSGRPAALARVTLGGETRVTDAEGRFAFDAVPLFRDLAPTVTAAEGRAAPFAPARAYPESPSPFLEISLVQAGTLRVTVVDPEARPVAGAAVAVTSADNRTESPVHAQRATDERGEAEVSGLDSGAHRVVVVAEGFDPAGVLVRVDPGAHARIALAPGETHWIAGRVVDERGEGRAAALSVSQGHETRRAATDAEGRFRVERLSLPRPPVGLRSQSMPWRRVVGVRVAGEGLAPADYDVPLDEESRLVVTRAARVRGRIVDESGEPLRSYSVRFRPDVAHVDPWSETPVRRLSGGRFEAQVLGVPGTLWVQPPEGTVSFPFAIRPEAAAETDLGDLRLPRLASWRHAVVGSDGQPPRAISGGVVLLPADGGEPVWLGMSRGESRPTSVPSGRWTALAVVPGYVGEPSGVDLAPGAATETRLRVWVASSVSVRVLEDERPYRGARCRLVAEGEHAAAVRLRRVGPGDARALPAPDPEGTTSAEGTCSFDPLAPGRYRLEVDARGSTTERSLELREGEHLSVDVPLTR